jgi:integrase
MALRSVRGAGALCIGLNACIGTRDDHYVQLIRAMSRWAVRKGYRDAPMVGDDSDVIRRKKEAQRHRRLEPGEEDKLLRSAGPHLQALIVAALETCGRQGELLIRLRVWRRDRSAGRQRQTRRQTAVLRGHGHKPAWIWKKKTGPNDKGSSRLSPESEAAYRAINLHFHDLRHEGGSRLLEAGWPVHYVQHMLGHASLQQTSTYLNATLRGLHESMRNLDQSRPACRPLANTPARGFRPVRKQAPARDGKSFFH